MSTQIGKAALISKGYKTAEQIAESSGMSVSHIRHLARLGEVNGGLPAHKCGRRWYFDPKKVHENLTGMSVDDGNTHEKIDIQPTQKLPKTTERSDLLSDL